MADEYKNINVSVLKQITRDKFTLIALLVLFVIYFSLLFADIIAPYSKDFSDRNQSYAPPSKIFTINEKGKLSLPYTYNYKREFDPEAMQVDYKLDRRHKYFLNTRVNQLGDFFPLNVLLV